MKTMQSCKWRGRGQKLEKAINNNVLVATMFRLHKYKVSSKFLIRCIEILCKENKDLFDMLVKSQELSTRPVQIHIGGHK
jgi:hypothetical protein